MIAEIMYFTALAIMGLGLFGKSLDKVGALLAAGIAIPAGLTFFGLIQLVFAIAGLKLNAISFWMLVLVLAAAAVTRMVISQQDKGTLITAGTIVAFAIIATAVFQILFNTAVLSFDSYDYVVLGSNLYRPDTELASRAMSGFLNNYPPLLWVAHSPARFFGAEFLALLHPVVFASTMGVCAGLVLFGLRKISMPVWIRWGAALAPSLVLLTTPQMLHHAVYLMPNVLTGALLAATVALLWIASERDAPASLLLPAAICLAGVTLARQEGGLMAAVVMVAFATAENVSWRAKTAFSLAVAIVATVWYATVFAVTGEASAEAILTPMNAALQFGCLWIAAAASIATAWPPLRSCITAGAYAMPWVLAIAHLPYLILTPAHTLQSIGTFFINMFWAGSLWGIWWVALVPVMALIFVSPDRIPRGSNIGLVLVTVFLLIDFLGVFRPAPYRLGDQDSGNRMLIHIFPLLWTYLIMRLVGSLSPEKLPRDTAPA
ncbi:MAG: hypothetical protein EOP50_01900 [Sphingobacteriales bacterium]|nr:MAG: hypothetical protein EOP50_01900 [Sphingobacteriales bacterium]